MSNPAAKSGDRKMEYVQITQAEEMPALSAVEKAELIASIKESDAQIDRGECLVFESTDDMAEWIKSEFENAIARHHGGKG